MKEKKLVPATLLWVPAHSSTAIPLGLVFISSVPGTRFLNSPWAQPMPGAFSVQGFLNFFFPSYVPISSPTRRDTASMANLLHSPMCTVCRLAIFSCVFRLLPRMPFPILPTWKATAPPSRSGSKATPWKSSQTEQAKALPRVPCHCLALCFPVVDKLSETGTGCFCLFSA